LSRFDDYILSCVGTAFFEEDSFRCVPIQFGQIFHRIERMFEITRRVDRRFRTVECIQAALQIDLADQRFAAPTGVTVIVPARLITSTPGFRGRP
jgi:hypothetical protein